jgi:multisubunit Na+/H+ antiporter MnhB subunit
LTNQLLPLIIGLFLVGFGFLVKSFPNLIAGYNTMTAEQKKHVDIKGLSTYMRNVFILMGLSIIIAHYLFTWMELMAMANFAPIVIIILGVIIMVIKSQQFNHNKHKSKRTILNYSILGLALVFIVGSSIYSSRPAKATITEDKIEFSGSYGFEMNISEIATIKLTDQLPPIGIRTNGFSMGSVKKGYFKLETLGECRLLVHSDTPPFLIISKHNGEKIIINYKNKTETEVLHNRLNTLN